MGWDYTNKPKNMTVKEFFEREFNREGAKLLDCKVKLSAAYIAMQYSDGIFAKICLIRYDSKSYFNFSAINLWARQCTRVLMTALEAYSKCLAHCRKMVVMMEPVNGDRNAGIM